MAHLKEYKKSSLALISLFIIVLVLSTVATIKSVKDIQKSSYLERAKSIDLAMSKIGDHLNIAFETRWHRARSLTTRIERLEAHSVDDLIKTLDNIQEETGVDFKVIDNAGIAYYPSGRQEYWKDHRSVLPKTETFILSTLQFGVTNENYMKYIVPLKSPLVIGDTTISYTVLTEPLKALRPDFDTGNYGEGCLSFIIDKRGTFIYENGSSDQIAASYNFLAYLEKSAVFKYDSTFKKFKENVQNNVNDTVLIEYNGTNYYMSLYSLDIDNWVSIMLVPEKNMQTEGVTFAQQLLHSIAVIFLTALLLIVIGFIYMWKKTVTRQRLAAEAERRANSAKTNFLSSMSHDIRTPMNAIVGLTEITLQNKDDLPFSVQDNLEKIRLSSSHLLTLINDILDIGKIESDKMTLHLSEFSITKMTHTVSNLIGPLARDKNINFTFHAHDYEQEFLIGDELRLSQICINLATNAVKYTPNGGKVDIEVTEEFPEDSDFVRIICTVEDNGIGMSEEFQNVMYETFKRETDSRLNAVSGSGLGLAICKKLVEMMNGTLKCESALGRGTTFKAIVLLQKGKENTRRKEIATESPEENSICGLKVLVAEDNNLNWEVVYRILTKNGACVWRAENGEVCVHMLEHCEPSSFDAVLMDVRMPVMDGLEATRIIRKSDKLWLHSIPIIAMTADAFTEDILLCKKAGMDDHLAKPISLDRLFSVLSKINKAKEESNEQS